MKLSTMILSILLVAFVTSIFATNMILKRQYDKIDKTDIYWNFKKIQGGSFKYLKITGGNLTNVAFEPGIHSSVRVLNYWNRYQDGRVKTAIKNDTLFLNIENRYTSLGEKYWMGSKTLIRIFSPELRSVYGTNTNLGLFKLKQKNLEITLAGKSVLEVESYTPSFDSISVIQKDSSKIEFEMAPELNSSKTMHLKALQADVQGYSILDVGHFKIQSLHYTIGDTAAIIFSGGTLKKILE